MPAESTADPQSRIDDLLARLGARDRANVEKHLAAMEAEADPSHAQAWRHAVGLLARFAPMPVTMVGTQAMQFFVADGKFRMQVFALEDKSDGQISIYLPDVMTAAVKEKIAAKSGDEEYVFGVGQKKHAMKVEALEAANTFDPPPYVKNLIGWNRKAVRLSIDVTRPEGPQIAAAEALIGIAVKQFPKAAAVVPPVK